VVNQKKGTMDVILPAWRSEGAGNSSAGDVFGLLAQLSVEKEQK